MPRRVVGLIVALAFIGAPSMSVSVRAQTTGIREVSASARSLITLQTRLRYTTMIVLPEGEEILDVICGDRDFWVVSAVQNVAHVKPAKADAETNLNLVTAHGTIYSFMLKEKTGSGQPDLKIYVNASETTSSGRPKYYSAADVERLNTELTEARNAIVKTEQRAKEAVSAATQDYPFNIEEIDNAGDTCADVLSSSFNHHESEIVAFVGLVSNVVRSKVFV